MPASSTLNEGGGFHPRNALVAGVGCVQQLARSMKAGAFTPATLVTPDDAGGRSDTAQ